MNFTADKLIAAFDNCESSASFEIDENTFAKLRTIKDGAGHYIMPGCLIFFNLPIKIAITNEELFCLRYDFSDGTFIRKDMLAELRKIENQ